MTPDLAKRGGCELCNLQTSLPGASIPGMHASAGDDFRASTAFEQAKQSDWTLVRKMLLSPIATRA